MNINGWVKNSFIDYPDKIATTIFVSGCNFLCPYCHNGDLVKCKDLNENYTEEEIINHLIVRNKMIEGICISGGEPTIYPDLKDFILKIKNLNNDKNLNLQNRIYIKLDTNGTNPKILKELLDENLIDYVAMDIKGPLSKYKKIVNKDNIIISDIEESIDILKNSKIKHEFRTTITRETLTPNDLVDIIKLLGPDEKYYLQQYVQSDKQIDKNQSGYSDDDIRDFVKVLLKYNKNVEYRNI